jgi:hypothetical protein
VAVQRDYNLAATTNWWHRRDNNPVATTNWLAVGGIDILETGQQLGSNFYKPANIRDRISTIRLGVRIDILKTD